MNTLKNVLFCIVLGLILFAGLMYATRAEGWFAGSTNYDQLIEADR